MSQEARCLTQFKQWVKYQCEAPELLWLTQLNKVVLRTVEMFWQNMLNVESIVCL